MLIASGERADRPVAEHDEPWTTSLFEGDHEFVDTVFAGDPAHSISEDARRCAVAVVDYAALYFAGRAPNPVPGSAQRLLDALRRADVAGFYDAEEGVVIAHPAHVPQERALREPHVLLQVFTASDGWPDRFSAGAWKPDGGGDFHEVATVFESATTRCTAPATLIPAPSHTHCPAPVSDDGGWTRLIDAVRESGQYATRPEAESVTRIVLSALGGHVIGAERVDLARALPEEAARLVASQIPATRPLTAAEFVDSVAARMAGATPATARWDVSSVLSVLPPLVGDDLVTRILAQLPSGYALLFGRADLSPAS